MVVVGVDPVGSILALPESLNEAGRYVSSYKVILRRKGHVFTSVQCTVNIVLVVGVGMIVEQSAVVCSEILEKIS